MTNFLLFSLLGIGIGALYGLVGQGLVLVYRGSGVLSFAQGAFAAAGGYQLYDLTQRNNWPLVPSMLVVVLELAVSGALVHILIMRRLAHSAPLVKLIASLGLFIAIEQAIAIRYGTDALVMPAFLPQNGVTILPHITIGADRMIIAGIALAVSVTLSLWLRHARSGLAVSAIAEDPTAAASLGWSPLRLGALTWSLGAVLAGVAGMLIAPMSGLDPTTAGLIVVPAMAAALVGRFRSFWLTLLGGVIIGIGESLTSLYVSAPGWTNSVPFIVIVITLVLGGRALPQRGDILERLPSVGSGRLRLPVLIAMVGAALILVLLVMPPLWTDGLSTSLEIALVLASIVLVTGYAGQLSLAQLSLAGLGALVAARLVIAGVPYELAIVLAGLSMITLGLMVGLVALRTRGTSLAIATLSLGLIIQALVLQSPSLTGGLNGLNTGQIKLFGISVYSATHSSRYTVVLVIVMALLVVALANLRRSIVGLRLLSVRGNERAAATLGINVVGTKMYAFSVAAAIAGFAGSFFAFRTSLLSFDMFNTLNSINVIALIVIGGIGYTAGPVLGSLLTAGGLIAVAASQWLGSDISRVLLLASGITMIVLVINNPNGIAAAGGVIGKVRSRQSGAPVRTVARSSRLLQRPASEAPRPAARPRQATCSLARVAQQPLLIEGLTVSFGQVRAIDDLSLVVPPATVIGFIGPNGAGKTTLIDAVSGFVPVRSGRVSLGDRRLDGRSRIGGPPWDWEGPSRRATCSPT